MNTHLRPILSPVALWVALCAVLNAAGWLLSAVGTLDRIGYVVFLAVVLTGAAFAWRAYRPVFRSGFRLRRFRSLFPFAFAVVAVLAVLGGVIHPPANYDGLAYRTPRVLHWLAEGNWHWIHTDYHRLNTRGAGIEWLTAPLILFTGTDRFLFLINAVSFLLLPGICYRLLVSLGVRRKVAWHWMWLIPSGYCFILQAGSIANDLFGATLAMAAMEYALRSVREKSFPLASLAILSAALMTAGKGFNLLLLLPWGLAMLPNMGLMLRRPFPSAAVGLLALLISLVPTSILNHNHSGDWRGLNAEPVKLSSGDPFYHLKVNAALISLHHLNPTVNPLAGKWNDWTERSLSEEWKEKAGRHFEDAAVTFQLGEMHMEEATGLGFGLALLVITLIFGRHHITSLPSWRRLPALALRPENLVTAGAWFSALYFLSQSGLACPARYLSPFYAMLLVPLLRLPRAEILTRKTWWKFSALLTFALAAVLLIVTPPRPLWPASTLLKALGADKSESTVLRRAWTVYSVYGDRADGFAPVVSQLPVDLDTLGFVTFDDPETSLWRPFGSRRIIHLTRADDARTAAAKGIVYALVSERTLNIPGKYTMDEWLERFDATITKSFDLNLLAARGPTKWHLVRLGNDS